METGWDSRLAKFLTDLLSVQDETLEVLGRKREALVAADAEELATLSQQEEKLIEKLQQCLQTRQAMLERAAAEGLPSDSLRSLTHALPRDRREGLPSQLKAVSARSRLLQHRGITNWVLAQRTLIHLSQMLEILATGGRLRPTYDKGGSTAASGGLVDRAA